MTGGTLQHAALWPLIDSMRIYTKGQYGKGTVGERSTWQLSYCVDMVITGNIYYWLTFPTMQPLICKQVHGAAFSIQAKKNRFHLHLTLQKRRNPELCPSELPYSRVLLINRIVNKSEILDCIMHKYQFLCAIVVGLETTTALSTRGVVPMIK
jgi:hypothetical protein